MPYPPSGGSGYQGYPPAGQSGYPQQQAGGYNQPPPYPQPNAQVPAGGVLHIHGENKPPHVGFVNPGYPMPPQQPPYGPSSGFVPLVPPQGGPYVHSGGYVDPEDPMGPEVKGFDFTEQSIRKGFIRKVYSILSVRKKAKNTN